MRRAKAQDLPNESVFKSSENSQIVGLTTKICFGTLAVETSMMLSSGNNLGSSAVIHHACRLEVLGLQPEHGFKIYS